MALATGSSGKQRRSATFCEQNYSKNFINLSRAGFAATGPVSKKFFAPLFSKKRLLPSLC
jgi:hypothetical protein